jgi:hypothetical protein
MPWGKPLAHSVEPRRLLGLPLAFTQNAFLTPEEFVKHAYEQVSADGAARMAMG